MGTQKGQKWLVVVLSMVATIGMGPLSITAQLEPFGLEEVMQPTNLRTITFGGTWVSGNQFLYTQSESILQYDVTTNLTRTLIEKPPVTVDSYKLSKDGQYMLLAHDVKKGFRHSVTARYLIYHLSSENSWPLGNDDYLQLATWAPQGNALTFVKFNNIYYRDSAANETEEIDFTKDGIPDVIYNGVPDWVYEEEVLGSGSALWFSPDGNSIAFARFDDTNVKNASYMLYGEPGTQESQYSQIRSIRYPKPGTPNPEVTFHVINVTTGEIENISPSETHDILAAVTWASNEEVVVIWANRVQNHSQVQRYKRQDSTFSNLDLNVQEPDGWVELPTPVFDPEGTRFLTILSQEQQNNSGNFAHLTLLTLSTPGIASSVALTAGLFVVTGIYGWDTNIRTIYYQATPENSPSQRHVYSVSEDGDAPKCLSCQVRSPEDNECKFASASFSTDLTYYALTCSGPDPTYVGLYSTNDPSTELLRWENNTGLRDALANKQMYHIINDKIPIPDLPGVEAEVRLWLPPNYAQLHLLQNEKLPMIVYVYGGPSSVQVLDTFTLGWGAYLTTNQHYIYALIDGRGSGLKGNKILFSLNRKLGQYEVLDQINVARELQKKYSFIDETRTGIWGWSYGGYATAMALARDTDNVFKCGASVAPVTNWLYYDTIYTERYMGLPDANDNEEGYKEGDVTQADKVKNFRNKQFFLLHGNADDNVHYQQAMVLSQALERENILFYQQSYPDEDHRIASVLLHVYYSMDHFWTECFHQDPPNVAGAITASAARVLTLLITVTLIYCGV